MSYVQLLLVVAVSATVSAAVSVILSYSLLTRSRRADEGLLWSAPKARPRRRYLVFEVGTASDVSEEEVRAAIEESFRRLFGEAGAADAGVKLIMYDRVRRRGVVRVRSNGLQRLLAALGTVRRIGQADVVIVPLRTAGTIRKARKYVYQ